MPNECASPSLRLAILVFLLITISCSEDESSDTVLPVGFEEPCSEPIDPNRLEIGNFIFDGYGLNWIEPDYDRFGFYGGTIPEFINDSVRAIDIYVTLGDVLTLKSDNTFSRIIQGMGDEMGEYTISGSELNLISESQDTTWFMSDAVGPNGITFIHRAQVMAVKNSIYDSLWNTEVGFDEFVESLGPFLEKVDVELLVFYPRASAWGCRNLD